MASLASPACFVVGGCGTERTSSMLANIGLPPTTSLSDTTTPHTSSLPTSSQPPPSLSPTTFPFIPTSSPTGPSISPQTSPSAPAASGMAPIWHSCQCTSTGTIVGIAIAAASAASVFTMLLLLCILRQNRRSTSKNNLRPLTDPFPESKNPNPSPSSIRDTVILISPDRDKPSVHGGSETRRSSESYYSQYSHGHNGDDKLRSSVSVPQLPAIILSPPLLTPSSSEFESQRQRSGMSPPGTPAHAYTHTENGSDARQTGVRSFASSRIPSVIGSSAGSDRTVLPRLIEVDGDALNVTVAVAAAAPLGMMPVARDSEDRDGRAVPA